MLKFVSLHNLQYNNSFENIHDNYKLMYFTDLFFWTFLINSLCAVVYNSPVCAISVKKLF